MDVALDPPYTELVRFLAVHPELEAAARRTLSYVDNAVLASRIRAKTLVSVGLRDTDHAAVDGLRSVQRDRQRRRRSRSSPTRGHDVPTAHAERQLAEFARELG